jgi:hypothetical protein
MALCYSVENHDGEAEVLIKGNEISKQEKKDK